MLYTKKNSYSVDVNFPIGTATCVFGAAEGSITTYGFQKMVMKDQILTPGDKPMLVCEHKDYDPEQGLLPANQGSSAAMGLWSYSHEFVGYTADPASVWNNISSFQYSLPRITNWLQYAMAKSEPLDNVYTDQTEPVLNVYENEHTEHYVESGGVVSANYNEITYKARFFECTSYQFRTEGFINPDTSNEYISGTIEASHPSAGYGPYFANWSAKSEHMRIRANRMHGSPYPNATLATSAKEPNNPQSNPAVYFYFKKNNVNTRISFEYEGESGLSAKITVNNPVRRSSLTNQIADYTGTNIQLLQYNSTGDNIPGVIKNPYNGKQDGGILATVSYHKVVNLDSLPQVDSYDPSEYVWVNTRAASDVVGGGGGIDITLNCNCVYPHKAHIAPSNIGVTSYNGAKNFKVKNDNLIPKCYGGVMLFSGEGLDSHFNVNEQKYLCVGIKGICTSSMPDVDTLQDYNIGCKIYKFNNEHFKKVYTNTYVFWDNEITPYYSTLDGNTDYGSDINVFSPIGPFFLQINGGTYIYKGAEKYPTFNFTEDNYFETPILLDTINYVSTEKAETNTDSQFLITKPASSIWYYSDWGVEVCRGNTKDCSYFAILKQKDFPMDNKYVSFKNTMTEITNMGKSMTGVRNISRVQGQPLTALTAIKSDWRYCTNITKMESLFDGATALQEIPNSWSGLSSISNVQNMFKGCTGLTTIPTDFNYTNLVHSNFSGMFSGCTKLTCDIAPILNQITAGCFPGNALQYSAMFAGCTGVKSGSNNYSQITADASKSAWYNYLFGLV